MVGTRLLVQSIFAVELISCTIYATVKVLPHSPTYLNFLTNTVGILPRYIINARIVRNTQKGSVMDYDSDGVTCLYSFCGRLSPQIRKWEHVLDNLVDIVPSSITIDSIPYSNVSTRHNDGVAHDEVQVRIIAIDEEPESPRSHRQLSQAFHSSYETMLNTLPPERSKFKFDLPNLQSFQTLGGPDKTNDTQRAGITARSIGINEVLDSFDFPSTSHPQHPTADATGNLLTYVIFIPSKDHSPTHIVDKGRGGQNRKTGNLLQINGGGGVIVVNGMHSTVGIQDDGTENDESNNPYVKRLENAMNEIVMDFSAYEAKQGSVVRMKGSSSDTSTDTISFFHQYYLLCSDLRMIVSMISERVDIIVTKQLATIVTSALDHLINAADGLNSDSDSDNDGRMIVVQNEINAALLDISSLKHESDHLTEPLYVQVDHIMAVFLTLIFPLLFPMLITLFREIKRYRETKSKLMDS